MTIEQALKIKQNWTAEQARNDLERLLLTGERPANKVIALACKALEKQIPKRAKNPKAECLTSARLVANLSTDGKNRTEILIYRVVSGADKRSTGSDTK